MSERLQKLLAQAGYGSRRACEALILQGRVAVNGRPAELGQKADPAVDQIMIDGERLSAAEQLTYIALHKPAGVVSSRDPQGPRETVLDLVPSTVRLYPVGRLDLDSEGLTLLTNDGDLANRLTHPSHNVEKEYRVLVKGHPDEDQLDDRRRGVVLTDRETNERRRTRPAKVWRDDAPGPTTWLRVVMQEGRKHEIREIGTSLGLPVLRLIRVRIGSLELGELRTGEWRSLDEREVRALRGRPTPRGKAGSERATASAKTSARRPAKGSARTQRPSRPGSAPSRPGSAASLPGSASSRSGSGPNRPGSGPNRPGSAPNRPGSAAPRKPGAGRPAAKAPSDGRRPAPKGPTQRLRMKSKKKP